MSDYIIRERFESNFAQVPKTALKDPSLSLKSKGLYAYLFSLPEDWKVYKTEIVNNFSDGKDSMNAAFKELESAGYLTSKVVKDDITKKFKGTILTLHIEPLRISRSGLAVDGFPVNGKPATTNTNNTNTGSTNNDLSKDKSMPTLFPEQPSSQVKKEEGARAKNLDERAAAFIDIFNRTSGDKRRVTSKVKAALKARLKDYNPEEIVKAMKNAFLDPFHKENSFLYVDPEYVLREKSIERYLHAKFEESVKAIVLQ